MSDFHDDPPKIWRAIIRVKGGKTVWKSYLPYQSRERAAEAAEVNLELFGAMKARLRPGAAQERVNR